MGKINKTEKLPNLPIGAKSIYSIDLMTEYIPYFLVYVKHKDTDPYNPIGDKLMARLTDIEVQLTDRKAPLIEITISLESMFISSSIFAYDSSTLLAGYFNMDKIQQTATSTPQPITDDLLNDEYVSSIDGITKFFDLGKKVKLDYGYNGFFSTIENYDITDFKLQLKNGGVVATIIAQKLGRRKDIIYPSIVYTKGTMIDILRDLVYRTGIELDPNIVEDIGKNVKELEDQIYEQQLSLDFLIQNESELYLSYIQELANTPPENRTEQASIPTQNVDDITGREKIAVDASVFLSLADKFLEIIKIRKDIALQKQTLEDLKGTASETNAFTDTFKLYEYSSNEPFVVQNETIRRTLLDLLSTLNITLEGSDDTLSLKRSNNYKLSYGKPNSEIKSVTFKTEDLQEKARYSGKPIITRSTPGVVIMNPNNTGKTTPAKSGGTVLMNPSAIDLATVRGSTRSTKNAYEQAKINRNARNVLTATVEMLSGYPAFYPLDKIELDLGNSFYSGIYVIDHVIHEFSDSGFKTKMELNKEASNKLKPKAKEGSFK
jgi:hypothetical protein